MRSTFDIFFFKKTSSRKFFEKKQKYKIEMHHEGCQCDICEQDSIYPATGFTLCTCLNCDPEQLWLGYGEHHRLCYCKTCQPQLYNQIEEQKEDVVLYHTEFGEQVIEIHDCGQGILSVNAINKCDLFTGEIIFVLNRKEADEEVAKICAT